MRTFRGQPVAIGWKTPPPRAGAVCSDGARAPYGHEANRRLRHGARCGRREGEEEQVVRRLVDRAGRCRCAGGRHLHAACLADRHLRLRDRRGRGLRRVGGGIAAVQEVLHRVGREAARAEAGRDRLRASRKGRLGRCGGGRAGPVGTDRRPACRRTGGGHGNPPAGGEDGTPLAAGPCRSV